jgi:hypothetical protein
VLWVETAPTMEEAKARIRRRAIHSPGEYIILCHATGNKFVVNAASAHGTCPAPVRFSSCEALGSEHCAGLAAGD